MEERAMYLKECLNDSVFILNQIDRIEKPNNPYKMIMENKIYFYL